MKIRNNLSGNKFNRLTVIEPIPRDIGERTKYKCICECGNEVIVEGSKIKNSHTKSCGCIRENVDYGHNRLEEGESSRNALIYNYRYTAKYKKIRFNLTDDEMIKMFESDCHYCGREPYKVTHKKNSFGGYIYTGIDRKDNNKDIGYTIDNTVPCCSKCNYTKNKMDYDEFIQWVEEVYNNLKKKKMGKNIIGKFKLNKTTLNNGKDALIIIGVAFPQDFDLNELSDSDEMWVTNIEIKGETIKCSEPYNECSPEEFLSGENQDLKSWKKQIKEDA